MGEQFRVEPTELHAFADYMSSVVYDFDKISTYVMREGCDTSGFTGLLAVLQPVVTGVGQRYNDVLNVGKDRLDGGSEGLHKVADNYVKTDDHHATQANNVANQMPAGG